MTFEIIIILAVAIIFVILVRKMPDESAQNLIKSVKPKWGFSLPSIKFDLPKMPRFSSLSRLAGLIKKERSKQNFDPFEEEKENLPDEQKKEFDIEKLKQADDWLAEGKMDEAEKMYVQLGAEFPGELRIFNRLGVVYLKQKNFADARDSFLQALKIDDTQASRHYNLAMAYLGMGTREKARVCFKKAIEIDPGREKYQKALEKI
ncbi:MAG: response regulator receiver protein [Candidatus Berkelbacteria bacterium Licking1014_7]|uniref:Response regulator receiver protein n=1 Tax=Candidatus Berkelbacteria bacterium Licking1014_7 TaxID=2017147 RepID=A0A554LK02_9BACT|nr:MAG: response regulator receiver protein [Candidatus Berkelbacteria bacterium Licking1014_7]